MLHAAPPLEVGGAGAAHTRCLLRDRGGHGAVPAAPLPLYGDDAATTKFLLERVLRGSSIAPYLPSSASSASSSTAAVDADPAEREDEDPGEPASGLVPSARVRGDGTTDASGAGAAPETALQRPLESAASAPASCLPALLGPEGRILIVANRLPVTVKRLVDGWDYSDSSGGLVSALRGMIPVPDRGLPKSLAGNMMRCMTTERVLSIN
jgi:hypothetical protein